MVDLVDLSRVVSHALRHGPWRYELELDEDGWAQVDEVLDALRAKGGDWVSVDRRSLERMIASSTKRRHELQGNRIRALYGHSLPGLIKRTPAQPPAQLFHGTAPETLSSIRAEGLRPMRRQYVHLSINTDTAIAVGRRKSSDPVILCVDVAGAHAAGAVFYEADEMVWLADQIPPNFIKIAD
jgi:putative RNA 2'-phosphotransferase